MKDQTTTNDVNILVNFRDFKVKCLISALSFSTYEDAKELPKLEDIIKNSMPLNIVTKYVNKLYADILKKIYNFESIFLRYFNVFVRRKNLNGSYSAVILKFAKQLNRFLNLL